MSERKTFTSFEIKDAAKGEVVAEIATLNVKDRDGDVATPGFVRDGQPAVISAYGHKTWDGALPVGRGTITTRGDKLVFDGKFFMDTQHGKDTFTTVKEVGDLQEWSWGYDVLPGGAQKGEKDGETVRFLGPREDGSAGVLIHEVSPVLKGASIGTQTVAVKNNETVTWATTGGSNTNYTIVADPPQPKDEDEDDERKARSFADDAEHTLGSVQALIERAEALGRLRAAKSRKEGRALSTANRDRLTSLRTSMQDSMDALDGLLAETDPEAGKHRDDLITAAAAFQAHLAAL